MTKLERLFKTFIGHASKRGATSEEMEILTKSMALIKKYQSIEKN